MTQARDRPPLGRLLTAGKRRSGIDWLTIERDLDIRRATREAWMNGTVQRYPLREVLALCHYLGITAEECAQAVLYGRLPRWVTRETEPSAGAAASAATLARRSARLASPRAPRRPPARTGNGNGQA